MIRFPHILPVIHLPKLKRLAHPVTLRHVAGVGLGLAVSLIGSFMAVHGSHQVLFPHTFWDAIAYTIHGFGAIPILKHGEPLWEIFIGG